MKSILPPGITDNMIPGNSPGDDNWEKVLDEVEVSSVYMPYGWDIDRAVVVLNDGETYTNLAGCKILLIPREVTEEDLDQYVKDCKDLVPPV